jgi:AcrR family transcriptional regulator
MALTRTPRTSWIEEGLRALARGGPDAVRVESLAQTLGVTKGGFYWQFDGRGALLEEMLDTWERVVIDEVIERVERGGGDAREKLRRLSSLASPRGEFKRVDNRRMDYMRSLFSKLSRDEDEVEARCLLALSLFIANRLIAADHGANSRSHVVGRALSWLES